MDPPGLVVVLWVEQTLVLLLDERVLRVVLLLLKIAFARVGALVSFGEFLLQELVILEAFLEMGDLPEILLGVLLELEDAHDHVLLEEVLDARLELRLHLQHRNLATNQLQ